jgi:hypothetical protein
MLYETLYAACLNFSFFASYLSPFFQSAKVIEDIFLASVKRTSDGSLPAFTLASNCYFHGPDDVERAAPLKTSLSVRL